MEERAGFNRPRVARDDYALGLWRRHGLGDHPTLEEISPVARRLLADRETCFEGAAIVLGRHVSASDQDVDGIISVALANGPNQAFGLLLLKLTEELHPPQS